MQTAFILHTRPYRDTSLLVDLLTQKHGRITAIAKGVRTLRARTSGLYILFTPLFVELGGKNELQIIKKIEPDGMGYNLNGTALLCGFYLNELIIKLLHKHEAHIDIFSNYQNTLMLLARCENTFQLELALRLFEKSLVSSLGFGLVLNKSADNELVIANCEYIFEYGVGFKKANKSAKNVFLGKDLLALYTEKLETIDNLKSAKKILRHVLSILLDGKKLKSRELLI